MSNIRDIYALRHKDSGCYVLAIDLEGDPFLVYATLEDARDGLADHIDRYFEGMEDSYEIVKLVVLEDIPVS